MDLPLVVTLGACSGPPAHSAADDESNQADSSEETVREAEPEHVVEKPAPAPKDEQKQLSEQERLAANAAIEGLGCRADTNESGQIIAVRPRSLVIDKSKAVSDAGLRHLEGLTKLDSLGLTETKVTDDGVERLEKALPDCIIIP